MSATMASSAASRLDDQMKLECRICWYVYDPAEGDPVEQIAPGTAFSALPDYWRCPQCDAEPNAFLPVSD